MGDVDTDKALVSKTKNYKYFIGNPRDGNKVKLLNIMLAKTSAYAKNYDRQTKLLYFLIEDYVWLEKYNIIWDKNQRWYKKGIW